jgi:4-diphosphocytidyl-2-C-methyl-D-erythritol kinase
MTSELRLPPVSIHLHKQIPVGAGLGGGSSNASTVLSGLNALAASPISTEKLAVLAGQLGSDCPFFLHRYPMMMEGRGELLSRVSVSLDSFYLVLLFPEIHISTAEAYRSVSPRIPEQDLNQLIGVPVERWRDRLVNDFEASIFTEYPLLKSCKLSLYRAGAVYASMSGSGSSLYGLFKARPELGAGIRKHVIWEGVI